MDDTTTRIWSDLVGRLTGPMTFRLILQPAMSMIYAVRDGVKDQREGRPPYFWAMFTHPGHARAMLDEGFKAIGRVILLGVVMDGIYQFIVFRWFYPGEMIIAVLMLTFVPYLLVRGPATRLAELFRRSDNFPSH
jgi:hypothetical protein